MMIACGSSRLSVSGLNVTRYLFEQEGSQLTLNTGRWTSALFQICDLENGSPKLAYTWTANSTEVITMSVQTKISLTQHQKKINAFAKLHMGGSVISTK